MRPALFAFACVARHPMAPHQGACGRGCAPVPNSMWGRGLSERSEFHSPNKRDRGKGPRRATPGRPWFWVLLPKQKDLVVRGRSPARTFFLLSSSTLVPDILNRGSSQSTRIQRLAFVFSRRGRISCGPPSSLPRRPRACASRTWFTK